MSGNSGMENQPTKNASRCRSRGRGGPRRRHDGFHTRPPGGKPRMECLGFRRLLSGEVMLLARVVAQVVELDAAVLIPFDQLQVSVAHGTRGSASLVAVMGIVPK